MMLLPFGPVVGRAYADELRDSIGRGDTAGMHECLGVLSFLAPPDEAPLLAELAGRSSGGTDAQMAVEASWALGNLRGSTTELTRAEARVADAVRGALANPEHVPEELFAAWAYALGMRGRRDLLRALDAPHPRRPDGTWEEARRWRLDLPGHLRPGAGPEPSGGQPPLLVRATAHPGKIGA
jgi:hypothetical protein